MTMGERQLVGLSRYSFVREVLVELDTLTNLALSESRSSRSVVSSTLSSALSSPTSSRRRAAAEWVVVLGSAVKDACTESVQRKIQPRAKPFQCK